MFKIISDPEWVMNFTPTKILYVYGCWQDLFEKYRDKVNFYHGWDHDDLKLAKLPRDSLLIVDDAVELHENPDFIRSFYTKDSHHLGVSIICVYHNVYTKLVPHMREISLNTINTILTTNKRAQDQIECLSRQIFKKQSKCFMEIYRKLCEEQNFGYVLLNLHPCTSNLAKIQCCIFREEAPTVLYVPKT